MAGKPSAYPSQYETEALLRDGSRILLRPIKLEDAEAWLGFVQRLDEHSKYLRFHHVPGEMGLEEAHRFANVDYDNSFAFVAEALKDERRDIVAVGRYYRLPDRHTAEIAVVIEDEYQGRGIGTKLMEWLANVAREHGITTFEGDVMAENEQMMNVLKDYGFHLTSDLESGVYHVSFPIARTPRIMKREEERERLAAIESMRYIFSPRSVAVIGASREAGSIGQLIMQCILRSGFSGVVYPVNPNATAVMSVKAYPSVLDIPGDVDLAIIVVPAKLVARVADECGRKGVHALIVISDGFKERGPEGAERERELRSIALGHGMRVVGPNCMGVINTDPRVNLNGTFSTIYPQPGNVSFLSQSGAMGLVILEYASNLAMGISSFISIGNRADVSSNDLLQYWEEDPATRVILLYLESFGTPRQFSRTARRVSVRKPIVVVKGGTTPAGSRAAASHTGALATSEIVSDALFRQAGIMRVNSIEELFDVAILFSNQPIPSGRRVAIVTNGGGPGIIAADACANQGLTLPEFSPETVALLKAGMKRDILFNNPLDLTAGASGEEFENTLRVLAADDGNDAVLTIFVPPVPAAAKATEDAIGRVAPLFQRRRKPLVACFMGQQGYKAKLGSPGRFVPSYPFPEGAVLALAKAAEYAETRRRPRGKIPGIRSLRCSEARQTIEAVMKHSAQRPLWLSPADVFTMLNCYGIRTVQSVVADTPARAAEAASSLGFPVVVKLNSTTIAHKSDVGGVALDLKSEAEVEKAFRDIQSKLTAQGRAKEMQGVVVQPMVSGGVEAIAGVTQDPYFGPIIMFGTGGTYAELLNDVAVRLHPLTDIDARELIRSVKLARLFDGFRGAPPSDTESVQDMLLRLSALVEDVPEIAELDLNPVKVMPRGEGYCVVDARILAR